jgi:hypothetical protein
MTIFDNLQLSSITYRTSTGFGQATNRTVAWPLRELRHSASQLEAYVVSLCDRPPVAQAKSILPTLPDELLLQIAHSTYGDTRTADLRRLSLTCHQMPSIARETLSCTAIEHPRDLPNCLNQLVQHTAMMFNMTKLTFEVSSIVRQGPRNIL